MLQRRLGVCGRDIGMALFAMIDGFLQMLDSFGSMRICLCLLAGFGVSQRGFGVRDENTGVALLAMVDRFLGVLDGFRDMVLRGQ